MGRLGWKREGVADHMGEVRVFGQRGARQFSAQGKKDLMSAAMYCYLAFRVWLRAGNWVAGIKPENRALFSMK